MVKGLGNQAPFFVFVTVVTVLQLIFFLFPLYTDNSAAYTPFLP